MPISLTSFAIGACAVWRVAHLIACEDGPGDILFLIRQRLGQGFAGRLIDCFDCVSIWISALALLVRASWGERIIIWIGISGAACLLERISTRNRGVVTEDNRRNEKCHVVAGREQRSNSKRRRRKDLAREWFAIRGVRPSPCRDRSPGKNILFPRNSRCNTWTYATRRTFRRYRTSSNNFFSPVVTFDYLLSLYK